ncbi:MAG: membrane protein insertase YidC [Desulfuromonadaceae bacterium]|nr:membrane protein insertase YidC [Desulfuromonadaceae bacterium]MDD2850197.1 membrane protein insertase YidC [Desulfuromonadaceae bacterium]MDD4131592.1 membrane protein insertase YidC [Desulfuromonadaceae bacterium]
MEKRAFIAVGLSIAVFYLFSLFFGPDKQKVEPPAPQTVSSPDSSQAVKTQNPGLLQSSTPVTVQQLPSTAPTKDVTVETDLYTAVFSSRGASLKSMTLKNYREENTPTSNKVTLGNDADPNLLSFSTRATGFNLPDGTVFAVDADGIKVEKDGSRQLTFNYVSGQGYTVRKVYTFSYGQYGIKLETQVFNNSAAPLVGTIQYVMTYPAQPKVKNNRFDTAGSYIFADNGLQSNKIKDVASSSKRYDKTIQWSGFADKYFLNAILSENNSIASVELLKSNTGFFESVVSSPQFTVNPGKSVTIANRLFVGPKDIDILKAQGNSLVRSLDLGWFTVIAKPLLYSLKFFYRYVGNYGIAIIIITVILKAFFFPLTHKSYKSMKGMQKIQPEMAKLREKFKDDKDSMNKAVMELYREHKVNPMGGCLPMVVQIPVFFALYKSLMFSIELRHAPFFFWITDLADKDPYYVTPVIMGITMFLQQKMTPSNMDPMQQKMMLALPVVFTFMFLSFPSGLVLYWLVNNVLTIGQQMYINKTVE